MLLRPRWKRLRRHWVCYGIGTVCASTLAITGCSRAPMARFKEMTSAQPAQTADEPGETRAVSSERPDPRDAVASDEPRTADTEGRVTIVGDRDRRGSFKGYREGYADLRNRLLNRGSQVGGDPFLEADANAARDFPATDSLAPQTKPPTTPPAVDNTVARADLTQRRGGAIGTASLQKSSVLEGVARTQPPSQPTVSRLEQLRAELRKQREGAATTSETLAVAPVGDTDRGQVLSTGGDTGEGIARTGPQARAEAERKTAALADTPPATPSGAGASPTATVAEDLTLRVQSLLVTADWLAGQGDLEQAYRNAMLAQRLADHGGLHFGPHDRQPTEVSRRIWEQIQGRDSSGELAKSLPAPKLPSAASRRPVPKGAFPGSDLVTWQKATGPSAIIPADGAMPVITPNRTADRPALPAPATAPQEKAEPPAQPLESLEDVAQGPVANPVTLAAIDKPAPVAAETVKPASLPAPTASPPGGKPAGGGIVNAIAEAPAKPGRADKSHAEPTGLTVPAMASLPKAARAIPPQDGPALKGPQLARAKPDESDAPPVLDVIGARKLPSGPGVEQPSKKRRGLLWGVGALVVVLLGAALAFRRRWSAGTAAKE